MSRLLCYTRKPIDNVLYDPKLAYSMHLALQEGELFRPLNHNSGVLFALATENEDGSLNPMSLRNPWVFPLKDGGYGVAAVRVCGDGEDDCTSRGSILLWTTQDLVVYRELGLMKLGEQYVEWVRAAYDGKRNCYLLCWRERSGCCYQALYPLTMMQERILGDGPAAGGCEPLLTCIVDAENGENMLGEIPRKPERDFSRQAGNIEGVVPHCVVEIKEHEAWYLQCKLLPPVNVCVETPQEIKIHLDELAREESKSAGEESKSAGEQNESAGQENESAGQENESAGQERQRELVLQVLQKYQAIVRYNDGTFCRKRIDWNLENTDLLRRGSQVIQGEIYRPCFPFPVAYNRADPCVTRWNGRYYFIATNDADENHTLYIREADTLEGLAQAREVLLLDCGTYEGIGGLLWAPEFHEIEGRLYIFHAATPGPFYEEESHIMALREGGNPANREDWSAPRRVVKMDGTDLCQAGKTISLDMTCFFFYGEYYVIWSQRQFLPKDLGAWLYIAKLDAQEPWRLASEPVVLSRPDYGWANNHTFVEEGPYALPVGDMLYVTFSAAAVDTSYVVSYLVIERGKDLLLRENWRKNNYPILTSRSVEGEYGTGHNAYVEDGEGVLWNTYHARPGAEGVRSSGIRRVHFDIDGAPVLDMTEEMDLRETYRQVKTKLVIS